MKFFYGDVVKPKDGFYKNTRFYISGCGCTAEGMSVYYCHVIVAYGDNRNFCFDEDKLELAAKPCSALQSAVESAADHAATCPAPSTGA